MTSGGLLWTVALLGCLAAAGTMSSDHAVDPVLQASMLDWIILSYILSGLVAWCVVQRAGSAR